MTPLVLRPKDSSYSTLNNGQYTDVSQPIRALPFDQNLIQGRVSHNGRMVRPASKASGGATNNINFETMDAPSRGGVDTSHGALSHTKGMMPGNNTFNNQIVKPASINNNSFVFKNPQ